MNMNTICFTEAGILTAGLAAGFGAGVGFLGGGASSSRTPFGIGLGADFFPAGAAAGAGALAGAGPPALHFTVAFSKASLIFAFRKSGRPSIVALSGRSPTIFMRVPKQVAASLRAPSNPSSSNTAKVSANGLI